jgi:DNA polymerase/3'-5' exonuclease PolX
VKKVIRLTESDLARIVERVILETNEIKDCSSCVTTATEKSGIKNVGDKEKEKIKTLLKKDKAPTYEELKKILPDSDDYWAMTKFVTYLSYCLSTC